MSKAEKIQHAKDLETGIRTLAEENGFVIDLSMISFNLVEDKEQVTITFACRTVV